MISKLDPSVKIPVSSDITPMPVPGVPKRRGRPRKNPLPEPRIKRRVLTDDNKAKLHAGLKAYHATRKELA